MPAIVRTFWRRLSVILVTVITAAGCDLLTGDDCSAEVKFDVSPTIVVVAPAQSATPTIRATSCGGREELAVPDWRFTSSDSMIATVDSISGRITGRRLGQTYVTARSRERGFTALVNVTVQ